MDIYLYLPEIGSDWIIVQIKSFSRLTKHVFQWGFLLWHKIE